MRIMAIDYGDAHTGIAISDPTGLLTGQTTTIHSRNPDTVAKEIARLARENGVEELVMGFPRNMDGTEGPRAELYRGFAAQVAVASGLVPVLWDERRTTVDAHRILKEAGKNGKRRKKIVDAVAASLILEGYLTYKRWNG
ncbi:MAG: Holliday junction resolvase RuvX [Intestinimonas sp.]|jgi:putative Holliday junction resolvase|nr:Holliday junction resolvase RuvX [Intestinimonas sp.]